MYDSEQILDKNYMKVSQSYSLLKKMIGLILQEKNLSDRLLT